jgi:hypothetical protein
VPSDDGRSRKAVRADPDATSDNPRPVRIDDPSSVVTGR